MASRLCVEKKRKVPELRFLEEGRERLKQSHHPWIVEGLRSIKVIEIEEWHDLIVYRPLGWVLAKAAIFCGIRPTAISIMSLMFGVVAGGLFYFRDSVLLLSWACVCLFISGLLDTVDGQVARLARQSTPLGRMIDGHVDAGVFIAVYVGASFALLEVWGPWLLVLAFASGYFQSLRHLHFDFHKQEFAFLYTGQVAYRIQCPEELSRTHKNWLERVFGFLEFQYLKKQQRFIARSVATRRRFEQLSKAPQSSPAFRAYYKKNYFGYLKSWALWGGLNSHRYAIMLACLTGHFEFFIVLSLVSAFPAWWINKSLANQDKITLSHFAVSDSGLV